MKTTQIATVNHVSILIVNDKEKLVPIKPICEALGIDEDAQRRKLKDDDFLNSVTVLSTATGSDGKQYEMVTLPYRFIFGWLFTINPKNVKPEAKEAVAKYRIECYEALFHNFASQSEFLEDKNVALEKELENYQSIQEEFKTAKNRLAESKEKLNKIKQATFEQWQENNRQLSMDI